MASSFNPSGPTGSLRQGDQPDGPPLDDLPIGNNFEACPDRPIGSLRQGGRTNLDTNFTRGRGAGRTLEAVYPLTQMYVDGNSPGIAPMSRFGQPNAVQITVGQAPATNVPVLYKGRMAFAMSAVAGIAQVAGPFVAWPSRKGGARHKGDFSCWRFKLLAAAAPAGGGDLGMWLTMEQNGASFLPGTNAGFALRAAADHSITFYSRANVSVGFQISDVCPIITDVTEYNVYDLRITGATDDQDAKLRVVINGLEQFVYSFGDGLLPEGLMQVSIGSRGGGTLYVPPGGALVAAAYDENSLL